MGQVYISPTGSGNRSGSDAANAAAVTSLDAMIVKAGGGGQVLMLADQGAYTITKPIDIKHGGTDAAVVTIKGVSSTGADMDVVIQGNRNPVYAAANPTGNELFKFQSGANHIVIEHMSIANVGTAFRAAADVNDITIQHVEASNVGRFFEDYAGGSNKTATITGLTLKDIDVEGFSKGVVRLGYNTNTVLIENVHGDSMRQDGDKFAIGVHLEDTAHDVTIRKSVMENATDTTSSYWNGDGFATESKVYNILFEDTMSRGNTDAGYDLKSQSTTLVRTESEDNSRNYRVWGDVTMNDVVGLNPDKRGGSLNGQNQVWIADTGKLTINGGYFADAGTRGSVFYNDGGTVAMKDVQIIYAGTVKAGDSMALTGATITKVAAQGLASVGAVFASEPSDPVTPPAGYHAIAATSASETLTGTAAADMFVYGTGKTGTDTIKSFGANDVLVAKAALTDNNGDGIITFDAKAGLKLSASAGTILLPDVTHGLRLLGHTDAGYIYGNADTWAAGATVDLNAAPSTTDTTTTAAPVVLAQTHALVSTSASETLAGTSGSDSFHFDQAAKIGSDTIKGFGSNDVLVTSKMLSDTDGDGLIALGTGGTLSFSSSRDGVKIEDGTGLRYLGHSSEGYVYGDAAVRTTGAKEGLLGIADTLKADAADKVADAFFIDTALGQDLGSDRIVNFGASDMIVTTSKLGTGSAATGGGFDMAGHGTLSISDTSGRAVQALAYDGDQILHGTHYYVYSLSAMGESVGSMLT